jgi:hypothetical protein
MSAIPTIGIYMHRLQQWHGQQMRAIAELAGRSYDMILVQEPGTVHENINRVLRRAYEKNVRYLCLMDDDAIPLNEGFLDTLMDVMNATPDCGVIQAMEIQQAELRNKYIAKQRHKQLPSNLAQHTMLRIPWLQGFLAFFDLWKTPGLWADEAIPHPVGMSDLDLSLQVRKAGFQTYVCGCVAVYHPEKPMRPHAKEHNEDQCKYMFQKWGQFFYDVASEYYPPTRYTDVL